LGITKSNLVSTFGFDVAIVFRNTGSLLIAQILIRLLQFLSVFFLLRYLGPQHFGQYAAVLGLVYIITMVGDLGTTNMTIREMSHSETMFRNILGNFVWVQIFLAMGSFALMLAVAPIVFVGQSELIGGVLLAAFPATVKSLGNPFSAALTADQKMHFQSAVVVVAVFFETATIIIGILWHFDLPFFYFAPIGAAVVKTGLLVAVALHCCPKPEWGINLRLLYKMLALSVPFALLMSFNAAYTRIGILLLSRLEGDTAAGLFAASYRVIEVAIMLIVALTGALYPVMSRQFSESFSRYAQTVANSNRWTLLIGSFVALVVFGFAKELILVLGGKDYMAAVHTVQILSVALLFISGYAMLSNTVVTMRRTMFAVMANLLALTVNTGLMLLLVKRASFTGAAIAQVLTEGLILLVYARFISKNLPLAGFGINLAKMGIVSVVTISLLRLGAALNPLLRFIGLCSVFGFLVWRLGLLDSNDRVLLKVAVHTSLSQVTRMYHFVWRND
jgi:O-antigen/teichoic acid export membrane protein